MFNSFSTKLPSNECLLLPFVNNDDVNTNRSKIWQRTVIWDFAEFLEHLFWLRIIFWHREFNEIHKITWIGNDVLEEWEKSIRWTRPKIQRIQIGNLFKKTFSTCKWMRIISYWKFRSDVFVWIEKVTVKFHLFLLILPFFALWQKKKNKKSVQLINWSFYRK